MKILITGAAGFIGYHVSKLLMNTEATVVGIDNMNDYYEVSLKNDRLGDLGITHVSEKLVRSTKGNFSFMKLDISDLIRLKDLFKTQEFTHVIHLAAQAGVRYSIENPHAYSQSNLVGFVNMLECCRHQDIKHLIYASSSSVYGNSTQIPFSEDYPADEPISLYAATKRSNELMAYSYSHLYQLPTSGLRFFTVYGPWGRPDMAPMLFAHAINKGEAIKVFNNGDAMRDFTYIDDIVKSIVGLLNKAVIRTENTPPCQVLNIGNSTPVNLLEFIETVEGCMGKEANKIMMPKQPGDVDSTWADTKKLRALVPLDRFTSLNEGITKFISWFNTYYNV